MENLIDLFNYTYFTNAVLTSILGAISCGFIGTYIVTKRLVFITGGITHASFGGLGIAYFLGYPPLLGAGIFGVLAASSVQFLSDRQKIRVDSAIAMTWSLGMAIGIIFIFMTPGYAPNLMSYLFGSILTVVHSDLWIMSLLTLIILVFFIPNLQSIHYLAFDEEFARSKGVKVNLYNYVLMVLIAITAVIYIRVAGIILVLSLLTVPQNLALLISSRFKHIILYSVLFGLTGSVIGLYLSYFLDIPSGAAIIFTLILQYFIGFVVVRTRKQIKKRKSIS